MECNKDEAIRAVELSERKIRTRDFNKAKEMALKAQRLYPQLENISRLITVCEVHCSAENKIGGSEMDWYGILQIQQFDDEVTIKRQYRKLGLLLHPDKNIFAGAEAAFKLIGQANRVLMDKASRSQYDVKCSALTGNKSLGYQSVNLFGNNPCNAGSSAQSRYASMNLHMPVNLQQPVQPDTVRIACPSCKKMYEYNLANRLIFCEICLGIFDAGELGPEPSKSNGGTGNPSSTTAHNEKRDTKNGVGTEKQRVDLSESSPMKSKNSRSTRSTRKKTGEDTTFHSGESSKIEGRVKPDSEATTPEKVCNLSQVSEEHHSRRSSKTKHNVSLMETLDDGDDDNVSPPEVMMESSLSYASRKKRNIASMDGVRRPTVLALRADDYNNVGKIRVRRIGGLHSRNRKNGEIHFEVKEEVMVEDNVNMANASGSKSVAVTDGSKSVADTNGSKSVADTNGSKSVADTNGSKSTADTNRRKSMADTNVSKSTADTNRRKSMADTNGSKSTADTNRRKSMADTNVSKSTADTNHRKSMADTNVSKSTADTNRRKSMADTNVSKSMADTNSSKSTADTNGSKSMADYSSSKYRASMQKIEPEFSRFVLGKDLLQRTVKANQIWVLFDPADGMPRRYACIKKVFTPGFRVKITWLEPDPDDQGEVDWCSKKLPVACGKFGLALTEEVTDHTVFSHENLNCAKGKNRSTFQIYPRKGETWALYRDWDLSWSSEPEKHSQYKFDFVEVLTDFSEKYGARVAYLGKVKGFLSLFQSDEQHGVSQVRPTELYRFSHQIPSKLMTGVEGYGVPAGAFELDPASLPASIFDRRNTVTVAKPSSSVPPGRPGRPTKLQVKSDEPIVID